MSYPGSRCTYPGVIRWPVPVAIRRLIRKLSGRLIRSLIRKLSGLLLAGGSATAAVAFRRWRLGASSIASGAFVPQLNGCGCVTRELIRSYPWPYPDLIRIYHGRPPAIWVSNARARPIVGPTAWCSPGVSFSLSQGVSGRTSLNNVKQLIQATYPG